jgi:hypothetical protein
VCVWNYTELKMKKALLIIAPLFSILASCSSGFHYKKQGVTQLQQNKDGYECRKEATYQTSNAQVNAYGGTASSGTKVDVKMAAACLRARGYQVTWE